MSLKPSSQIFNIGSKVTEVVVNDFVEQQIDLQLNPLDNEVLAIYAVDFQLDVPEMIQGTNTSVSCQLTKRSQTALVGIDNNDVIAAQSIGIRTDATGAVSFENRTLTDTPASNAIDYVALVATSDLFLAMDNAGNTQLKTGRVKIWARRMVADASTYAALVQSELLSN